ncbi:flagellar assembly protein A [Campylobacter hepaticus]|uniref:flagellar assembly protein A n=1 Tax=Campylobacter hepaticus TaxID=1813019 RepID=UPI0029AC47C9|nr:flagellar assembly protein A [Campylobacter hepaticus]MDX2331230.1 DUF342 domain-containing protein [Campylobacter hepaticus]MDX2371845.1 DUF342 domain-containing protein [Campylobacter hepaticus]MDX2397736.1 DUF342 domain-containing protein [Campylobacter hepaticus]MDX5509003.1 DUF342 domain-containing protein [Campylobacter hepaticus]
MDFQIKTLETFDPFESLKYEQKNTDEILDFRIIDFKLLCSNIKPPKTKIYERKDFNLFYIDDFFVKNYDTIIQKFIIEIYPKTQKENFIIRFKSNANLTYLKAYITFMDDFQYYPNLKFDLLQNIYKTMIKRKFLILRLDKKIYKKIDKFVSSMQKNQSIKKLNLAIAKGVDKIEHKKIDEIIFHKDIDEIYTNNNLTEEEKKYKSIQKNELLFEYIYKILGKEGRNLKGEILHINPINFLQNPFIIKDESIYTQELDDRIQYFSANHGFLNKDHIGYSIINDTNLSKISYLNQNTTKSNTINIQASNIKINANIGSVQVYAKNMSIKGSTHTNSEIFAENIYIKTHKGNLQADTVYINNLEYGNVVAKNIFVENCTGGTIKAENIYIYNLLTNNILYPRKNLIIANDLKSNNSVNIFPLFPMKNQYDQEYENMKNLCLKVKNKLYTTINKMHNYYDYLIKNQIKIIKFQQIKNPHTIEKYNELSSSYKRFIKLKHDISTKLSCLDEMIYKVKIYIQTQNIGQNNFLKFYPKSYNENELKHLISPKDYKRVFYLEKEQEKNYIKSNNDYNENEIKKIKALFKDLRKNNL